jgi:hypothetical protein
VPHLLRHGTSVFKVISERPVILTSECRALGEGVITTYSKRLRFDAAVLSGARTHNLPLTGALPLGYGNRFSSDENENERKVGYFGLKVRFFLHRKTSLRLHDILVHRSVLIQGFKVNGFQKLCT